MQATLDEQLLQFCATLLFSILQLLKLYQDSKCNDVTRRPQYKVPLTVNKAELPNKMSLCYEVHGQANKTYNLISDTCISVNALYSPMTSETRVISKIGVLAKDNGGRCQEIEVDLERCAVRVNGQVMSAYKEDGVEVHRRATKKVCITVSNCESVLVIRVYCKAKKGSPMMPFDISKETSLGRTSHGLVGECSTSYSIGQSVHAIMRRH